MTPPERPEVAAELAERHVRATKPTMEPDPTSSMLVRQTAYCQFCASHRPDEDPRWPCETARLLELVRADAAEPLRGALAILDVIDGIVDDTHPEGDGCPLCIALDDLRAALEHVPTTSADEWHETSDAQLRAALEATAPSKPEPALDVERLARAIHASHEHPNLSGCLDMDRDTADVLAREYLTSEPRAAAPQTKPEDAG